MKLDFEIKKVKCYNVDCMEFMKDVPDNYYDLAIVDPPYGKKPSRDDNGTFGSPNTRKFNSNDDSWDVRPKKEYFIELERISKNRIIWGMNYFIDFLQPTNSIIVWDKKTGKNMFADCELAWSNHTSNVKKMDLFWLGSHCHRIETLIHPTQKPAQLYKWLLEKYAKVGDKIIDTHGGSMSLGCACMDMGFECDIMEIDKEYFNDAVNRLKNNVQEYLEF